MLPGMWIILVRGTARKHNMLHRLQWYANGSYMNSHSTEIP